MTPKLYSFLHVFWIDNVLLQSEHGTTSVENVVELNL